MPQCQTDISYGVAEFDLSEMRSGERFLQLTAPIRKYKKSYDIGNNNMHVQSQGNSKFT